MFLELDLFQSTHDKSESEQHYDVFVADGETFPRGRHTPYGQGMG